MSADMEIQYARRELRKKARQRFWERDRLSEASDFDSIGQAFRGGYNEAYFQGVQDALQIMSREDRPVITEKEN